MIHQNSLKNAHYCPCLIGIPFSLPTQLQARLERMERRLAISQRNSKASRYDTGEFDPANNLSANENSASLLDSVASSLTPRMRRHRDSVAGSDKHERSRSSSKDRVCKTGRSSRVSSHSGTPIPAELNESSLTAVGKRNAKRKLSENLPVESSSRKKRPKQVEIRTRVEYEGLNLPPPRTPRDWGDGGCLPCGERPTAAATSTNHFVNSRQNSADLANSVPSPCMSSSGHSGEVSSSEGKAAVLNGTDATSATTTILVPSWRTFVVKTNIELDPNIIEVSFSHLHLPILSFFPTQRLSHILKFVVHWNPKCRGPDKCQWCR